MEGFIVTDAGSQDKEEEGSCCVPWEQWLINQDLNVNTDMGPSWGPRNHSVTSRRQSLLPATGSELQNIVNH